MGLVSLEAELNVKLCFVLWMWYISGSIL